MTTRCHYNAQGNCKFKGIGMHKDILTTAVFKYKLEYEMGWVGKKEEVGTKEQRVGETEEERRRIERRQKITHPSHSALKKRIIICKLLCKHHHSIILLPSMSEVELLEVA
jgi:hypothetical protein